MFALDTLNYYLNQIDVITMITGMLLSLAINDNLVLIAWWHIHEL